jgi:cell division septation protein DedD
MWNNLVKHLLLVLAISSVTFVQAQSTVSGLLRKARQQFETKNYSQAIDTYKEVLAKRADENEALGNIAECYRLINNLEDASESYLKLIRTRKNNDAQLLNYAHTLKGLGKYDEAKVYYLNYAKSNPSVGNQFAQSCDFAKNNATLPNGLTVANERSNSPAADFGPAFNSEQIIFSSARAGANNLLYTASIGADGFLGAATALRSGAGDFGQGPASFSADGRSVAYTRNKFVNGVRQIPETMTDLSLFLADAGFGGNWSNERPYPNNDSRGKTAFPAFTPDGNALFFASDREGGFGGWDLYIAYKEGGSWTKPINLGSTVNTPGDEITPYFDGTNLYFASDWQMGFGGFDIFMAEQGDGKWIKSTNLGSPINSPRDDYGYIFDTFRNLGYFTSNRAGGRGMEDIYRVSKATDNFQLRVVNAADGTPLPNAIVDLSSCMRGGVRNYTLNTDARGVLIFPVGAGTDCEINVSLDGYLSNRVALAPLVSQGARDVEIALTRRGEDYYGKTVSSDNQRPLEGVAVNARNNVNGAITKVFSDRNGTYVLGLSRNTSYAITYSASGFQDVVRNVYTLDGGDKTILGNVPMIAIGSFPNNPSNPNPYPSNPSNPNPYPPYNPPTNNPNPPQVIGSGYSVQLAALATQPNLGNYNNLRSFGSLYTVNEGGKVKLRMGVYRTREEAARQLANVKPMGYPGAFIVTETGSGQVQPTNPQPNPPYQPSYPNNPSTNNGGKFKIQLGAFRSAGSFNSSKLAGLGTIEDRPRGDLTLKLLCCFNSAAEAGQTLVRVHQAGFPEAFVVQDVNGQLVRAK